MELKIRLAKLEDMSQIEEIEKTAFPPAEAEEKEGYIWRKENFPEYFYVGEIDGVIVTFLCMVNMQQETITDDIYGMGNWQRGTTVAGLSLATAVEHRGKGYAGFILDYTVRKVKEMGMKRFVLCAKAEKTAFYQKHGFESLGVSQSAHGGAIWYDMVRYL